MSSKAWLQAILGCVNLSLITNKFLNAYTFVVTMLMGMNAGKVLRTFNFEKDFPFIKQFCYRGGCP